MRERERQRQRQTDRQTDRQRESKSIVADTIRVRTDFAHTKESRGLEPENVFNVNA